MKKAKIKNNNNHTILLEFTIFSETLIILDISNQKHLIDALECGTNA